MGSPELPNCRIRTCKAPKARFDVSLWDLVKQPGDAISSRARMFPNYVVQPENVPLPITVGLWVTNVMTRRFGHPTRLQTDTL